jgi:hypothetical protein
MSMQLSNEISLDTPTGKVYGTVEIPAGEGPFPVILIISGSGPTDRDGNSASLPGKNNSLKMLAAGLSTRGYASVRYDKRGIAESAAARPPEEQMNFNILVEDAAAFLRKLKSDARFDQFAIIGHSEGSLIGILAAQKVALDAYISLEGAGHTGQDTILAQLRSQLPGTLLEQVKHILEQLAAGQQVSPLPEEIGQVPALAGLFRPSIQPYLISWFQYDPADEFARLTAPCLVVQGENDLQVSITDAERLAAAKPGTQLVVIKDMNHVLKTAPLNRAANIAEYSDPELPLAPDLLDEITTFLNQSLKVRITA